MDIQPLNSYPASNVQPVPAAPVGNRRSPETSPQPGVPSNTKRTATTDPDPANGDRDNARELNEAVDKVNQFVNLMTTELKFMIDEDSGNRVIKVIDLATKDVIRQFPSEEMLSIARGLDRLQGLLVTQKA